MVDPGSCLTFRKSHLRVSTSRTGVWRIRFGAVGLHVVGRSSESLKAGVDYPATFPQLQSWFADDAAVVSTGVVAVAERAARCASALRGGGSHPVRGCAVTVAARHRLPPARSHPRRRDHRTRPHPSPRPTGRSPPPDVVRGATATRFVRSGSVLMMSRPAGRSGRSGEGRDHAEGSTAAARHRTGRGGGVARDHHRRDEWDGGSPGGAGGGGQRVEQPAPRHDRLPGGKIYVAEAGSGGDAECELGIHLARSTSGSPVRSPASSATARSSEW